MFLETSEISPLKGKTLISLSHVVRIKEAGPDSVFVTTTSDSFLIEMSYADFRSILEEFQTIRPFKYVRSPNGPSETY